MNIVSCQASNDNPNIQTMQSYPTVVCWQGWHMFHATVTLINISLFVFIASIVALALFEPRMTTNRLRARQNSEGEVIYILNKLVFQFIFSFTPFNNTWIYCLLLFILSGWLWTKYNIDSPYYNKSA
jgi:hypothetical protein